MKSITKLQWHILDVLSVDWESINTLGPIAELDGKPNRAELLAKELMVLYEAGLIKTRDHVGFNTTEILKEARQEKEQEHWFGLTDQGCAIWEAHAKEQTGRGIDWEKMWAGNLDLEGLVGHVEATNKEACLEFLRTNDFVRDGVEPDMDSLVEKPTTNVELAYYKRFPVGYRIEFKLRKTKPRPTNS